MRTAGITALSFNNLLLFGAWTPVAPATNFVEIITNADELLDKFGVAATDPLYRAAQVAFSQIPHIRQLYIGRDSGAAAVATNLQEINDENADWYGLVDVTHNEARAVDIATWVESKEKMFFTTLHSPANLAPAATDTTSTAALLKNGSFYRTAWWWHDDPAQFPEVAAAARLFTQYPGSETWANARLANVPATHLSETIANTIHAKNGNTYEPFRSVRITQQGRVAGGEWIDVIRFRDWLCEEIRLTVFQQMIDHRIPFTDAGIAIIKSRILEALARGVMRGGIAGEELTADGQDVILSYTVNVPAAADIPANQKAQRILTDVTFTARLAGAIHVVEIFGTLTYESLPVGAVAAAA